MVTSEEQEAIPRKSLEGSDPIFHLGCCLPIGVELGSVWRKEWLGFDRICGIFESSGERTAKWSRGIHQTIIREQSKRGRGAIGYTYLRAVYMENYSKLEQVLQIIIKLYKDLSTWLIQPLCIGHRIATRLILLFDL